MNRAILLGRLGKDPQSKKSKGGPMCFFSMATSEKHTGRDREAYEEVEWHQVVVFGKFAESCMKFLRKGSKVLVEGKIKTRSWEDKNGEKRYTTEVVASRVIFVDAKVDEAA
jgi:single-strand DNA-binding protein